jgi:hypothetical protein
LPLRKHVMSVYLSPRTGRLRKTSDEHSHVGIAGDNLPPASRKTDVDLVAVEAVCCIVAVHRKAVVDRRVVVVGRVAVVRRVVAVHNRLDCRAAEAIGIGSLDSRVADVPDMEVAARKDRVIAMVVAHSLDMAGKVDQPSQYRRSEIDGSDGSNRLWTDFARFVVKYQVCMR